MLYAIPCRIRGEKTKIKSQAEEQEKIFVSHLSDKVQICGIHRKLSKWDSNKTIELENGQIYEQTRH